MHNKTAMTRQVRPNFTDAQVRSFITLFKMTPAYPKGNMVAAADAMRRGLLFITTEGEVCDTVPTRVFDMAAEAHGINAEQFNQTFYKSFADVRDADPMQLLFDQILHYMTTYGAESIGVNIPTYIPATALEVPEVEAGSKFKFVVISVVSDSEMVERVDKYLGTLASPPTHYRKHIEELLPVTTLVTDDIKSFELQIVQHTRLGTVPKRPINVLRYLVYRTTGQTMLIKNRTMREMIKNASCRHDSIAFDIINQAAAGDLASIFFRFKPIFLAFKVHRGCAPIINHLRRLADTYHLPLLPNSLQNFTQVTDPVVQADIISKASNRDLVKLLNAMNVRVVAAEQGIEAPAVYQVRNGRTFVRADGLAPSDRVRAIGVMVYKVLIDRLMPIVKGRNFYMPMEIEYAIPTSERQFIGNIPYGTRINGVPDGALTAGVHWFDQKGQRVDIDLHLNSASQHFGWNAAYSEGRDIIYTGDLTDAPVERGGAAEAYWFSPNKDAYILSANLYSGPDNTDFKFFMTEQKPSGRTSGRGRSGQDGRYTFDPNNALFAPVPLKFSGENSLNIGMFANGNFWFYGGSLTRGIVPNANYEQFIKGLTAQLNGKMMLSYLLQAAGANVFRTHPDTWEIHFETEQARAEYMASVISLAPEDLAVDTLINVIDGNI